MKSTYIIVLIAFSFSALKAQTWNTNYNPPVGYFGPCDSNLFFYPTDSNIWQSGPTSIKSFFGLNGSQNAIMTDSVNPYPVNNHSWFDIELPPYLCTNEEIRFKHKLESTAEKDGGYITWSHDDGVTWYSLFDNDGYEGPHSIEYENLYFPEDSFESSNGFAGFNGSIDTFLNSRIKFIRAIPVRLMQGQKLEETNDTIIVRFHFVSDSIPDNKAGWIIKELQVAGVDVGGAVDEVIGGNHEITITPIISSDGVFNFSLDSELKLESLSIFNVSGKTIYQQNGIHSNELRVRLLAATGIYFYNLILSDGSLHNGKLMKLD